jgi:arylsulfatase A-like enzyme
MDAQVGYLLDTMDRLKLWENTIMLMFMAGSSMIIWDCGER